MSYDKSLARRIRSQLARRRNVDEKKMFGCIAFLVKGNAFVGVWKNSLIVRVGAEQYEMALREPDVREFNITGRPMRGWILVAPEGIVDDAELADWIDRAIRFTTKLPAK
jgi:hypothetical protein